MYYLKSIATRAIAKPQLKNSFIFLFFTLFSFQIQAQSPGHFKVRSDEFVQIGYDQYKVLSFGAGTGHLNNGHFAIEYWSGAGGLNFFKPWPTWNAQNYMLFLRDDGNVGIGGAGDSGFKLTVHGVIQASNYGFISSDKRLKTNIQPLNSALSMIMQLNAVRYQYNYTKDKYANIKAGEETEMKTKTMEADTEITAPKGNQIGFVAQEVKEVLPEIVGTDDEGYHSIQYTALIPVLVKALQEQQAQIEALETRLKALEEQ